MMNNTGDDDTRMTVRRMGFCYASTMSAHWNEQRPEFSQIVNAGSLAMPYLEPYLIKSMRAARPLIRDEGLRQELDTYIAQESTHCRQHRKFNDELAARGDRAIAAIEATLAADYERRSRDRSLTCGLAYAEGFESMALALGQMLIEDREYLFGGGESGVVSLILWHFVEEIEHKNVAFDVFEHVAGDYWWRVYGLLYATGHIFWRTPGAYQALLREDGRWRDWHSRLPLAKLLVRIFSKLGPKLARILLPGYNPRRIAAPDWARAWAGLFTSDHDAPGRLDTHRLSAAAPVALNP